MDTLEPLRAAFLVPCVKLKPSIDANPRESASQEDPETMIVISLAMPVLKNPSEVTVTKTKTNNLFMLFRFEFAPALRGD
jgi:hypothetical protein